jgi:hypothetical protein
VVASKTLNEIQLPRFIKKNIGNSAAIAGDTDPSSTTSKKFKIFYKNIILCSLTLLIMIFFTSKVAK